MKVDSVRLTTSAMRGIMFIASLLVLSVGLTLTFLTEETDKYFAWTINPPLTATFLGSAYLASCLLEFFSSREKEWAKGRIAVLPVIIFSFLILVVTVMHKDRFHFDDPRFITSAGTWFWLAIYAFVPLFMASFLLDQWQVEGVDAAPTAPIPRWLRVYYFLEGFLLMQVGILMLVTPENAATAWAWTLSALTGRAIGAWLIGLGFAVVMIGWENDWFRVRPALYSLVLFVILQFISFARYNDLIVWSDERIWIQIAVLLSILGKAVYSLQLSAK